MTTSQSNRTFKYQGSAIQFILYIMIMITAPFIAMIVNIIGEGMRQSETWEQFFKALSFMTIVFGIWMISLVSISAGIDCCCDNSETKEE